LPRGEAGAGLLPEAWSQLTGGWIELASVDSLQTAIQLPAVQRRGIAAAIDGNRVGLGVLQ
jgi:hypothetical protein